MKLSDRVEALVGPCREVDDAIATALFSDKHRTCIKGLSDAEGGMWMFRYPNGSIGSALRFTSSLDAALTLVPEGWDVDIRIRQNFSHTIMENADGSEVGSSNAPTPALALCAAALRERGL